MGTEFNMEELVNSIMMEFEIDHDRYDNCYMQIRRALQRNGLLNEGIRRVNPETNRQCRYYPLSVRQMILCDQLLYDYVRDCSSSPQIKNLPRFSDFQKQMEQSKEQYYKAMEEYDKLYPVPKETKTNTMLPSPRALTMPSPVAEIQSQESVSVPVEPSVSTSTITATSKAEPTNEPDDYFVSLISDKELLQKKQEIMIKAIFEKFYTPIDEDFLRADMNIWQHYDPEDPELMAREAKYRLDHPSGHYYHPLPPENTPEEDEPDQERNSLWKKK